MDFIKFGMQRIFEPKTNLKSKMPMDGQPRRASAVSTSSSARYYANRTHSLTILARPQNFAQKLMGSSRKKMDPKEMHRFSSIQSSIAAEVLNRE